MKGSVNDVTVFNRSRKGVTLTKAGESIYNDAKIIVRFCDDAKKRVHMASES